MFDEGSGNIAQIDVYGRLTQFNPVLDLNGGDVSGRDYSVTFREDQDTDLQIVDDDVFITDEDIDPKIMSITVNITNPRLDISQEYLSLSQDAPEEITVAGENTHCVVLTASDPSFSTIRDFFITTLLRLRYTNIADELGEEERVVTFIISDGLFTNDPIAVARIAIEEVNDVPVVDLNGDNDGTSIIVEYTEADPPTLLTPDATLEDPDSPNLSELTVDFEAYDTGNESVAVDMSVLPSGSSISCNLSPCNGTSLKLSGTAPSSDYQSLLRTLAYVNLKQPLELPNLRDRIITVRVRDELSLSASTTEILIDFLANQSRVIIQLDVPNQDYFTEYTEGQGERISVVGDQIRIVDTSLTTLQSVDVTIRNILPGGIREAGEEISVNTADLAGLQIGIEIHAILKRITFSGEAPLEDYLTAIRHVRYRNTEDEPNPTTRIIDFVVDPGGGAPQDFSFTNISIININDHFPVCTPEQQTVTIREDVTPMELVHTLIATDADVGIGGKVAYELIEGGESLFSCSPTGEVSVIANVDFESVKSHTVVVEACDNGITPDKFCCEFSLNINITDFNDEPPTFSEESYTLEVAENAITNITTFVITDADSGTNADIVDLSIDTNTYVPRTGCVGLFATTVNPPTLSTLAPGLDHETVTSCRFTIIATDGGGSNALTGTATVTVNIINEDDFPPKFTHTQFTFNVIEDNSFPLSIGHIEAEDIDSPSVAYSLQGTTDFEINSASGEITILFSTDHDIATNHSFECVATDPSSNSATAEVIVSVTPINNDQPTLDLNATDPDSANSRIPVVFIEESTEPVTLATDPLITDPDQVPLIISEIRARVANALHPSLEQLSVSLSVLSPYVDLSPADGSVLVLEPVNPTQLSDVYELIQHIQYINTEDEISICNQQLYDCAMGTNSRTILIQVRDGVNYSPEREAYVIFEAVNDPPELDLDAVASGTGHRTVFHEGQGAVSIVGSVSLTDDDDSMLTELKCSLTNPFDGTNEFLVIRGTVPNGLTATISSDGYNVTFTGTADISFYATAITLIQYDSTTSNPTDMAREVNCYASDAIARSNFAVAEIMFDTVNENPTLDLDSLSTTVNYSANFVEQGGPIQITGDVVIVDEDDNTMGSLTVTLLKPFAEESLSLDSGYTLPSQLTLTSSTSRLEISGLALIPAYRSLLSNVVYNNTAVELTDTTDRLVQFVLQDDGGATADPAYTQISITPVDDNQPVFEEIPEAFVLLENATSGTEVGRVKITDLDEPTGNDIPSFSITADSIPTFGTSDFFIVNYPDYMYEGIIRVSDGNAIDYDDHATNYSLIVLARSGLFITSITVSVSVTNLPDLEPIFTTFPLTFQVSENETLGTPLSPSMVVAVDPDALDTIEYDITGNEIGGVPLIDIHSTSGLLTVVGNIDIEIHGSEFVVNITARDSNSKTSYIATVRILGINEFHPRFSAPTYLAFITENEQPSADPIATVSATDVDEVLGDRNITYTIRSGIGSHLFSIDTSSGEVYQLQPVDYENFNTISLVVEANDNDPTPTVLTSTAQVEVTVGNINDESPFFNNLPADIVVSELASQHAAVFTVDFGDPDINYDLRFISIGLNTFAIDTATGEVTVTASLLDADEGQRRFFFIIELTDQNTAAEFSSVRTISAQLNITLEDINDIVPVFSADSYEGEVMENLDPGQSVVQVSATDGDYGLTPEGQSNGNNRVQYLLGSDAPDGLFVINNETGLITTSITLNREDGSEYVFTVIARDSPISESSNLRTTQVRINVIDVNEHNPEADPSQYYIFVEENTQPFLQTLAASQWSTEGSTTTSFSKGFTFPKYFCCRLVLTSCLGSCCLPDESTRILCVSVCVYSVGKHSVFFVLQWSQVCT